jgi:hypothetical protein
MTKVVTWSELEGRALQTVLEHDVLSVVEVVANVALI